MTCGENKCKGKTAVKELGSFVLIMNKRNKSAFRDSLEKGQSCEQIAMGGEEKKNQSMCQVT